VPYVTTVQPAFLIRHWLSWFCSGAKSSKIIFDVRLDRAIRSCVGHAGEHEPRCDLVIVQKALVRLVHTAWDDPPGAGAASPSSAGVGQVYALLFSRIEDVLVIGHLDGLIRLLSVF
jgi:hypothetical protein